jgi:formylglycine-generating enzyme required for sulfatase activity
MRLVLIPAGKFRMGSPAGEAEREDQEGPQREVEIRKPFYLGKFEVTQAQYEKVMHTNPSYFTAGAGGKDKVKGLDTRDFPVEMVSWIQAKQFCKTLSEQPQEKAAGRRYDLPTEAEWEYACRAGTSTPYSFGGRLNGEWANCNGKHPYGTKEEGQDLGRTCKVGSYAPNAFGLHDMHGNVWEWCNDYHDKDYYRLGVNKDPQGPSTGDKQVQRGGSWINDAKHCRAAYRLDRPPTLKTPTIGLRVRLRPDAP